MSSRMLLGRRGEVPFIGPETGRTVPNGIGIYRSPHGSVRYVLSVGHLPIAALQIVVGLNEPIIANVFVREGARRQGHARTLLDAAKLEYPTLRHASKADRTPEGDAWVEAMEKRT